MNAHFTYIDNRTLIYVSSLITEMNKLAQTRDWNDASIHFVSVCNDEGLEIGLIYFQNNDEEYVFVPDMTGEGIDRESLKYD